MNTYTTLLIVYGAVRLSFDLLWVLMRYWAWMNGREW